MVKFDLDVPSGRDVDTLTRHFDSPEIEHKRRIVEAVSEELGDDAELAVDLHWNFSPESAERLVTALEPYDLAWVEDLLPPENTEAMARFNRTTDVPLLTGENRYGRHGFRDLLGSDAVAFVAPDITKIGAIAELKKIADMAETHYVALAPHNAASPIGTVATAHVGATAPNFLAMEHHARELSWWEDLLARDEPLIADGRIEVPDGPGLGVELDWDVVDRHAK